MMLDSIEERLSSLINLRDQVLLATNSEAKIQVLDASKNVQMFLEKTPFLAHYVKELPLKEQLTIKSILAIGEGPVVFYGIDSDGDREKLDALIAVLQTVERFYEPIGGIVGYHTAILKLIRRLNHNGKGCHEIYHKPPGLDIAQDTDKTRQSVIWGIESLPMMAEIYPIGGAGDRLNLRDDNGLPLPAAVLPFCGRTLVEGKVRDLWAREYLYYKIHGKNIATPIALMTSQEKDNDRIIQEICEDLQWFGRKQENFIFFTQPLIPVITIEGHWSMAEPLVPSLKPGGHGVIWRLAKEQGVFDWLEGLGRKKALIRQINNPIAGTDHALLAFTGIGCHEDKTFGFASCYRLLNIAEGVNVLIETHTDEGDRYRITNIEYTDFDRKGIEDVPESAGSPYSRFPANTNILFADLSSVKEVANHDPVPGMLINMKTDFPYTDPQGNTRQVKGGRLESTMQNIADCFEDRDEENLQTYLTYNVRRKTISVTKNSYKAGGSIMETPEGAFYDLQANAHELLTKYCGFDVSPLCDEEEYLKHGPSVLFQYHPALGPLYSIIAQKIQGGRLARDAEMQLEIAEIEIRQLDLSGSMLIVADQVVGRKDANGVLTCSDDGGKCILRDVTIRNGGIDRLGTNIYWKNQIDRLESFSLDLHGNAEFIAEGVTFDGDYVIDVPDGCRMTAVMKGEDVVFHREEITKTTWYWMYSVDERCNILLENSEG